MSESRLHQGERLKWLIERSGFTAVEVSEKLDISRSSLYELYKKRDIDRGTLEKFCTLLKQDIRTFYPDISGKNILNDPEVEYEVLKEKNKSLEQMIKDKEVIIIQQQEIIELLKKKQSKAK